MEKFKNIAIVVLTILVAGLSFFFCVNFHTDNSMVSTVKTDTLYIHDTIEIEVKKDSIVYVDKKVVDTLYLPTPQDTTIIPIEQKHYQDTLADIWVSGYEANIDSIRYHIPQNTIYVEKTIEKQQKDPWYKNRFIISAGFGAHYGLVHKQWDVGPYIGLGIRIY